MKVPVVTKELSERLEQSEIDYMTSRVLAIKEREGNPMGVEVRKFGRATAFYVKEMPWGTFNTVKGIASNDIDNVDEIIQFYRERNRSFQFEIIPSKANADLLGYLSDKGFRQNGFHTTLYGVPNGNLAQFSHGVTIRELKEDEFELYGKLHCLGTGLNLNGASYVADNNRVLYDRPGWRFFIGFVEEHPAGVAVMHISNDVASLTFAATVPEFRRRGLQTAFLQKRIHEAELANCELVVGQASYASTSQNNMERAGLRIGYTRATWVEEK
ncbi:GNAT family N-acetyltransferase [Gordoniibacillus kamchatkensis]|uniref:GNAT family N-acetyltransferase n=1 Tax=Gordoniibacillus kamchatkensis TaxID=1590651 RepID=UPI000A6EA1A9|nr:GNAT family N-acetyltransferase [Paenibacillus sp. VKM B-2647]